MTLIIFVFSLWNSIPSVTSIPFPNRELCEKARGQAYVTVMTTTHGQAQFSAVCVESTK